MKMMVGNMNSIIWMKMENWAGFPLMEGLLLI